MILKDENIRTLLTANYRNKAACMQKAKALRIHADGLIPVELITERRPNEPEEVKTYRTKIYVPKTKNPICKVIASLGKIRRSQDWNIQYNPEATPKTVAEGETLQDYCEAQYPVHTSVTNWIFDELLKEYLMDPNGIIAVIPEHTDVKSNEYIKPVAKFFRSEQIVSYVENDYIVLRSNDKSVYRKKENGQVVQTEGDIYYILTENEFAKYEQINSRGQVKSTAVYNHNIGTLPAFKAGGAFFKRVNNDTIFESRIAGMIPDLDEAAREYSDLQAEILLHIHSEKYAYTNSDCPVCKGKGVILEKDDEGNKKEVQCKRCNGTGSVLNVSPYGIHLVQAAKAAEQQLPNPPIGYIQKTADIARLQDERVRQHIYDALAAVNMEFLAETPISQSGVAKQVDKDELNNFVNTIAEDIVRMMDRIYYLITEWRYRVVVPNEKARKGMLPQINVPTKYDLLSCNVLIQELKEAAQGNPNPAIMRELQIDFAKKRFNTNLEVARMVETTFDLDPLFGISEENKMTILSNKGITEIDYIISSNIQQFVRRAIQEHDEGFYSLDYNKKMDILKKYAEDVKKANEPKETLLPINIPPLNLDEDTEEQVEEHEKETKEKPKKVTNK